LLSPEENKYFLKKSVDLYKEKGLLHIDRMTKQKEGRKRLKIPKYTVT